MAEKSIDKPKKLFDGRRINSLVIHAGIDEGSTYCGLKINKTLRVVVFWVACNCKKCIDFSGYISICPKCHYGTIGSRCHFCAGDLNPGGKNFYYTFPIKGSYGYKEIPRWQNR